MRDRICSVAKVVLLIVASNYVVLFRTPRPPHALHPRW